MELMFQEPAKRGEWLLKHPFKMFVKGGVKEDYITAHEPIPKVPAHETPFENIDIRGCFRRDGSRASALNCGVLARE
jgi:hypothetical protein